MYETIFQAARHEDPLPELPVEVFPYRPIPGTEFRKPSIEQNGYPVPETFEQWGKFFDYKFNSWWGVVPPEVRQVWARFTQMAPGSTASPAAAAPSACCCASRPACASVAGYGRPRSSSRPST